MSQENVEVSSAHGTPASAETSRRCWQYSPPRWSGTRRSRCLGVMRCIGDTMEFVRFSEVWEALSDTSFDFPDIRDAGDKVVALGHFRARGVASGVATETPFAYIVEFKKGKVARVRSYLDPNEALEAAGLSE